MPKAKPKTVELKEGTLVVVFEGLKKVTKGPYAGEDTVGSLKVFIGTEQVGLLQNFKLEANANDVLPHLEFNFGNSLPDPADAEQETVLDRLRKSYGLYLDRIKTAFPWAKWTSPIGSSPPPAGPETS